MAPLDYDRLLGTREPAVRQPSESLRRRAADLRSQVDVERLRRLLAELPGPRSRLHSPAARAHLKAAERLVEDELRATGWSVERQAFRLTDEAGELDLPGPRTPHRYPLLEGENVVASRTGTSDEAVVVVAHLDTVRDAPGADDNGSGVAVALELGRLLGRRPVAPTASDATPTLILAFPDFEEIGLVGSRLLVERLASAYRIRAAIVLDTVGYRSREPRSQQVPAGLGLLYPQQGRRMREREARGDFTAVLYRRSSASIARAWAEAQLAVTGRDDAICLRDPGDLPTTGRLFRRVPFARNFSRSDHQRFWAAGIPAILLSDTANLRNPHYHEPTDRPETLDDELLADVTAATALVVSALANGTGGR